MDGDEADMEGSTQASQKRVRIRGKVATMGKVVAPGALAIIAQAQSTPFSSRRPAYAEDASYQKAVIGLGLGGVITLAGILQYKYPQYYLRLQGYIGLRKQMMIRETLSGSEPFLCDLEQRPECRPHCGRHLGCLTTHGMWWCLQKERPLFALEHFVAQGIDVLNKYEQRDVDYLPWRRKLEVLSDGTLKRLAGNALHCPTVCALVLAFFSSVEIIKQDEGGRLETQPGGATEPESLDRLETSLFEDQEEGVFPGSAAESPHVHQKLRGRGGGKSQVDKTLLDDLPDGPQDMTEALGWASRMVKMMDVDKQTAVLNMLSRVFIVSHYSGVDCWSLVLRRVMKALASELSMDDPKIPIVSMCEKDPKAHSLLQAYGESHCIFQDINDALDASTSWTVDIQGPAKNVSAPNAAAAWHQVSETLDEFFRNGFDVNRTAPCVNHKQHCPLYPRSSRRSSDSAVESGGLRHFGCAVASSTCTGFSPAGACLGTIGKSTRYFLTWKKERAKMHAVGAEKFIVHECVEQFPAADMFRDFMHTHDHVSIVLLPSWFGYPVNRPRRYTILWDKKMFKLNGEFNASTTVKAFGGKCTLNGGAFFMGPASLATSWASQLCATASRASPSTSSPSSSKGNK